MKHVFRRSVICLALSTIMMSSLVSTTAYLTDYEIGNASAKLGIPVQLFSIFDETKIELTLDGEIIAGAAKFEEEILLINGKVVGFSEEDWLTKEDVEDLGYEVIYEYSEEEMIHFVYIISEANKETEKEETPVESEKVEEGTSNTENSETTPSNENITETENPSILDEGNNQTNNEDGIIDTETELIPETESNIPKEEIPENDNSTQDTGKEGIIEENTETGSDDNIPEEETEASNTEENVNPDSVYDVGEDTTVQDEVNLDDNTPIQNELVMEEDTPEETETPDDASTNEPVEEPASNEQGLTGGTNGEFPGDGILTPEEIIKATERLDNSNGTNITEGETPVVDSGSENNSETENTSNTDGESTTVVE